MAAIRDLHKSSSRRRMDSYHGDNMELRGSVAILLSSSSRVKTPPPRCDSTLAFSSDASSSSSEGNRNIHLRSLSPWSWRSSTVANRIPSTLWEADCSSNFCSSPNEEQMDGHDLNSLPIYQNVLVLNRKDHGRCYVASYQSVAVGCTCVWAKKTQN
ncbi:interleukin 17a/f2 [Anoplopoma fimbria]|uniref:interleukin 17a/f2 n=1 Tax=Anoplopoma fimbria TaxID=229290 RepID=UPI0023EBF4AD|nr:interleukin 17a/f2 [Anoplopoma fimbria]